MKNKFVIKGDVTEIIIDSPKYGKVITRISTEKLIRVQEMPNKWSVSWMNNSQSLYVTADIFKDGNRRKVSLHRWVMGEPKGHLVDHIDHDTLNNTDRNLRLASASENNQNRRRAPSSNTSGYRGVIFNKRYGTWRAGFKLNGKYHYLGSYKTADEANDVVTAARAIHMPYSKEGMGA